MISDVGGRVWFTAERAKVIGSYDPSSKTVDWVLGTGQNRTHMIFVFDDLKRIVTSNVSSGTMSIIEETAGYGFGPGPGPGSGPAGGPGGPPAGGPHQGPPRVDWDETVVAVGRGAEGFDVSPSGKEIWAANAQDGTISIVEVAGKKVAETLAANVRGANRLKFTPDGRRVFVSSLGRGGGGHFRSGQSPIGETSEGWTWRGGHPDGSRRLACVCSLLPG